jgi:hypothetical protein
MTAEIDTGYFKGHIQIQHPYRGINTEITGEIVP